MQSTIAGRKSIETILNIVISRSNVNKVESGVEISQKKRMDTDNDKNESDDISIFVFATEIVYSIHFINQKFETSICNHLLWLYNPVCD